MEDPLTPCTSVRGFCLYTDIQSAFIHSPFTFRKQHTFSSRERNTQIIYIKLLFWHPDFVYNVWLYFTEAGNIRLWQSYSKQKQCFTEEAFTGDSRLHWEVCLFVLTHSQQTSILQLMLLIKNNQNHAIHLFIIKYT